MRNLKLVISLGLFSAALSAHCQFFQPWTPNARGFVSTVKACFGPTASPVAAYDDFVSTNTTNLTVAVWWGNVSSPAQLTRKYYVAVYNPIPGSCLPDLASGPIYQACVTPFSSAMAGTDCQGNAVYIMGALLPGGFPAVGGQRYFLQISESDINSVNVGVPDFRWAGHFVNVNCPALQIGSGLINSPLQGCGALNDLAFALF